MAINEQTLKTAEEIADKAAKSGLLKRLWRALVKALTKNGK